jgi:hypothetical protein
MTIPPFTKRLTTSSASARNDATWPAAKRSHRIKRWFSTAAGRMGPWIAILAFIISIGSLTIASWQYRAVTRHYRLSVRPHVVITFPLEGGTGERNGIYLANPGLGPAIIKALSVEVGGKSYDAAEQRVWKNIFRDLGLVLGCFRQGWAPVGTAIKPGDEIGLLTVTHAKPPVVDGRSCHIELLKFLRAEGLKVHMQYESMYGEPHEAIGESWVDSEIISDTAVGIMQQHVVPKMVKQVEGMLPQLHELVDRLQRMQDKTIKYMSYSGELMLLHYLYEDPTGAPPDWWVPK